MSAAQCQVQPPLLSACSPGSIVSTHKNQIAAGTSDNARRFSGCVRKLHGLSAVVTKQTTFMFRDKPFTAIGTFLRPPGSRRAPGIGRSSVISAGEPTAQAPERLSEGAGGYGEISVSRRVKAPAGKRITVLWHLSIDGSS